MAYTEYTPERAELLSKLVFPEAELLAGIKILWYDVLDAENVGHLTYTGEHLHTFYEIHISLHGSLQYECDGEIYEICEGEALFIPPQTIHKYLCESTDMLKLSIGFAELSADKQSFLSSVSAGKTKTSSDVRESLRFIFRQADKKDIFSPRIIGARVFEIIYSVCEGMGTTFGELATDYSDSRFIIAKEYIEKNRHRMINCDDVARECCLSVKQLGRIFKKNASVSLFDYIISSKTEYAKILLLADDTSIKEISYMLGFESEGGFTSFFKRHCGISPVAFRKQHGKYFRNMSEK